jgi:hypothetical protein
VFTRMTRDEKDSVQVNRKAPLAPHCRPILSHFGVNGVFAAAPAIARSVVAAEVAAVAGQSGIDLTAADAAVG